MTSDNHNKTAGNDDLVQECIYRTPGPWHGPFMRPTEKLNNADQGWSVFTSTGRILTTAMSTIEPLALQDAEKRKVALLSFHSAEKLLIDYQAAHALLAQKGTKNEINSVLEALQAAGYEKTSSEKKHRCIFTYTLEGFLTDFGMFVPIFCEAATKLRHLCPNATMAFELDDDDDAPPECILIIGIPSGTPDLPERHEALLKFLARAVAPIQNAINLAHDTNTFVFDVKVSVSQ